jgi:NAD(P) transhydrogenase subunit alpha
MDAIVTVNNVKIIGWSNMASRIAADSSKLYAKNLYNFLEHAINKEKFNFEDEIVKQMLLIRDGKAINEQFKGML